MCILRFPWGFMRLLVLVKVHGHWACLVCYSRFIRRCNAKACQVLHSRWQEWVRKSSPGGGGGQGNITIRKIPDVIISRGSSDVPMTAVAGKRHGGRGLPLQSWLSRQMPSLFTLSSQPWAKYPFLELNRSLQNIYLACQSTCSLLVIILRRK